MKKLCVILLILLILISSSACKSNNTTPTTENPDYLSEIMKKSDEYPQLTKDEFIEILDEFLSTGEWALSPEKAFMHTSGVHCSWYIVEQEYLFFLSADIHYSDISTGAVDYVDYDFYLSHYADGVEIKTERDPLLFKEFLK